jgi:hypothetical protein
LGKNGPNANETAASRCGRFYLVKGPILNPALPSGGQIAACES